MPDDVRPGCGRRAYVHAVVSQADGRTAEVIAGSGFSRTVLFAAILVVHGLLHAIGFAKAFGLAELPQLTRPISPVAGTLWLTAALLFLAAAASLFLWPRWWWLIGAAAVVMSLSVILPSWTDAKFGVLGNLVVLVGVIFGFLAYGPASLRGAYDRDVNRGLAHAVAR